MIECNYFQRNINYYIFFQKIFSRDAKKRLEAMKTDFTLKKPKVKEILYISIHCRRKDYLDQMSFMYNSSYMDTQTYYKSAINYLKTIYIEVKPLLVSNKVFYLL